MTLMSISLLHFGTRTAPMCAFQPDVRNFRQDERDRLLREARERALDQGPRSGPGEGLDGVKGRSLNGER